jgi:hypothetical protein
MDNILARSQKTVRSRQKVAEYIEIAQLFILRHAIHLRPKVSFGEPIRLIDDRETGHQAGFNENLTEQARILMQEHLPKTSN